MTATASPIDAVNMLIVGFEGRLRQWLSLLQKKTPTLLADWAAAVVLNDQGQPQLLSDGSTENNFIGKLISAIEQEFIGHRGDTTTVQTLALNQMKLKDMTKFHAHYEEYLRRLFQLPNALDQQWKNHFISTLPKWFAERLIPIFKDPRHRDSWGAIHQGIIGLIMQLCAEQKQIKHVNSAKNKYLISPLCKQYHVDSGISSKISRGAGHKDKYKHKKHHKPSHRYKSYQSKHRTQRQPPAHISAKSRRRSSKRSVPENIKCYKCGKNHFLTDCPLLSKRKKAVKEEVNHCI